MITTSTGAEACLGMINFDRYSVLMKNREAEPAAANHSQYWDIAAEAFEKMAEELKSEFLIYTRGGSSGANDGAGGQSGGSVLDEITDNVDAGFF